MAGRTGLRSVFWNRLLIVAVAATVAIDAALLTVATGLVTGGFGAPSRPSLAGLAEYVFASAVVDAWLVICLWLVARPLLVRFGGGRLRSASLGLIVATAPTTLIALLTYKLHSVIGGLVHNRLLARSLFDFSTSSSTVLEAWLPGTDEIVLLLVACALAFVPVVAGRFEAGRSAQAVAVPTIPRLAIAAVGAGVLGTIVLAASASRSDLSREGLASKASGQLLSVAVQFVTDWDRDGFGWLSRPRDPDPVDSSIHPYAIEIPGNGIDENGVGGDRPKEFPLAAGPGPPTAVPDDPPDVLMIFLEGFRPELIGMQIDGRPVAPFLARLAREGTQSHRTFVHTPWTLQSRDQLFRGRIDEDRRGESLVDELRRQGYFVAHFSGQDDSYGDSAADLGFERADVFYDARRDVDRKTSRTAMPVSLQVSWKTVLERVLGFLSAHRDDARPLFLYVNIVDTHFPYTHAELDEIVASPDLPRRAIRIENAQRVFRTYANAAANVDRAIEQLVAAWRRRSGGERSVLLVTGDHGEALYENGTLGHGQTIESLESRIPLIVAGVAGRWPEPIAISEIGGLLLSSLANGDAASGPEFASEPDKRVFQYLGSLTKPEQIALRTDEGVVVLDLRSGTSWKLGPDERRLETAPDPEALRELIWTWETLASEQQVGSERDGASPGGARTRAGRAASSPRDDRPDL